MEVKRKCDVMVQKIDVPAPTAKISCQVCMSIYTGDYD